jgi:ATP-dependent DNA helicase RecG
MKNAKSISSINDVVESLFRLTDTQKKALKRLRIETVEDLLYHFPAKYGESYDPTKIDQLDARAKVTVFGEITNIKTGKTFRGRQPVAKATIKDDTGSVGATWFSQPYIAKMFHVGDLVRVEGSVSTKKVSDRWSISNPKIEKVRDIPDNFDGSLFATAIDAETGKPLVDNSGDMLHPTYPESRGVTSNWIHHAIEKVFRSDAFAEIDKADPIPDEILKKYNLPNLKTALIWIHAPRTEKDALSARKRFAFEEIFYIQLQRQKQRAEIKDLQSYEIKTTKDDVKKFIDKFGFEMTDGQKKALDAVLKDMSTPGSMSRLLEGDVGSGKTAVAATAVYAVTQNKPAGRKYGNLQAAYMVPTEILAKQHFENFVKYFEGTGIQIGLLTGSGCYKFPSKVSPTEATKISRAQLVKWIASGDIPVLVGTHALIQKTVEFKNLGLVIIDEQHRFGTEQRRALAQKGDFAPHLLSMTATPIPRTLALTIYGDLDLTLLDQMPTGRKPVITDIIPPAESEREKVYEKMREEIAAGRQAYVICPRIDEPDPAKITAVQAKSVKAEAKRLRDKIFPDLTIGEMHSKMKPAEKESVMADFESGKTDILVSTSVVEVGVNVPNATMILIEGAQRFGLAQLHQLRGRVIRSNHQAHCFVFSDSQSKTAMDRLNALKTAKNGFELSELDLGLRGSGQLAGAKQWGISDVGMEAIKNIKMVEAAREEAAKMIAVDPTLTKNLNLAEKIARREEIHFE